jgi:nucleoside-diphosphate-sugar epimerase
MLAAVRNTAMNYFVTGATGFIGGRVAQLLRAAGHGVVAVVRDPARATALAQIGVTLAKGDVTDKESMRAPMRGVDGVFHIAGWYKVGVKDSGDGVRINVDGTRNVLALMQELKIAKGVYTSSLAVNSDTHGVEVDDTHRFTGTHLSEYDRTKAEAHHIAEALIAQGLPLVIVQPGLVYGPGDTSAAHDTFVQYLTGKLPMLIRQTAYSWAHVDDIAAAHVAAMLRGVPGQNYLICGPTHTLVDAMAIAQKISGVKPPAFVAAPSLIKAMAGLMGIIGVVVPLPAQYSAEFLRISAGVTYIGSNAKARRELGFNPRTLADGLHETLAWEQQQIKSAQR